MLHHVILLMMLLLVFSQQVAGKCLKNLTEVRPKRYFNYGGETRAIQLETSQRISHQITTHIFSILLQEPMGYPNVSVKVREDYFNMSFFERISNMTPKPVNLEVWISPDTDVKHYTYDDIEECGSLGPGGRFGWFVPEMLVNKTSFTPHWRMFSNPEDASIFDFSDSLMEDIMEYTKDKVTKEYFCKEGFCENGSYVPEQCKRHRHKPAASCAVLLTDYPSYTQFVKEHIDELQLFVKVVWIGSNLKTVVEDLITRYESDHQNPFVFLTWKPNEITISEKYVGISFPACDTMNSSKIFGCKYELYRLEKVSSSALKENARPAYEAVHRFSLSNEQYENLIKRYSADKDPSTLQKAAKIACEWLQENEAAWHKWIPNDPMEKTKLIIGGIFPITSSMHTAKGIVRAASMAVDAVNANDTILRDYSLTLLVNDGQCKSDMVMKSFIDYKASENYKPMIGILGPACSDTVEPLAGVTKHFKTVVISYSAEGSSFSNREKYPYFFRTIGENKQYLHVYLQLLNQMDWTQVAALTEDGQKYSEYVSHLEDFLKANNITFLVNKKFPHDRKNVNMAQYLQDMKKLNARIIIGDFYDSAARVVMCEAYKQHMTAEDNYVWFLPMWLSPEWYNTTLHPGEVNCSTEQMIKAINGHLALAHAYFALKDEVMQENKTVGEWRKIYEEQCRTNNQLSSNYAGYAYDAVWTYALALHRLLNESESYVANLHTNTTVTRFVSYISETDFHGVSGRIKFYGGDSRYSVINVLQWLNGTTTIIGQYTPNTSEGKSEVAGGNLSLNMSAVKWLTNDGKRPEDGRQPPTCILQSFAEFLGTTCETAIVVANVIGFGLLVIFLTLAFIIVKRRYDKKVQLTQKYMKSLGIDLLSASSMGSLDKWEIPRDRVVINRKLGEGAFGTVYGGEAHFNEHGWMAVAVKTLKVGSTTEEKLDFLSEAEVMKRFDHKNIVRLLGVCTKNEPVYTVMEFMLYGDLKTFLLARRHLVSDRNAEEADEISSKKLTTMALDAARALSYLAELKYVHRDIACRNCLVNANRTVKLGDFGMTRPMYENDYYKFNRKGMLPVRWMSPESLGLGIFTPMSDVWSFGVLLYEIITFGSFPFQGLSNNQVLEHVKAGNTLTIPAGLKPQLEGLIRSCWNIETKKRPHASEIVEFLANNPRLIVPCLDVPLASVQIEGNESEPNLPEKMRKCSISLSNKNVGSLRHRSFSGNTDSLTSLPRNDGLVSLYCSCNSATPLENGGHGCIREPLLGNQRSPTGMCLTKYVTLQPQADESDDYCSDVCQDQNNVVTML